MIQTRTLSGTTDASGDKTVTDTLLVTGVLAGIACSVSALASTADTTITVTGGPGTDDVALLTLTNVNTDDYKVPSPSVVDTAGAAITDSNARFAFSGKFKVVVASGGNAKAFDFTFYFDDLRP